MPQQIVVAPMKKTRHVGMYFSELHGSIFDQKTISVPKKMFIFYLPSILIFTLHTPFAVISVLVYTLPFKLWHFCLSFIIFIFI
jgi:hypothetical protein